MNRRGLSYAVRTTTHQAMTADAPAIQAVLWDVDNTLIHNGPLHYRVVAAWCSKRGCLLTTEEYGRLQGKTPPQQFAMLQQMFAIDADAHTFAEECAHFYRLWLRWDMRRKAPLEAFKRVEALGIPQACVADGDREMTRATLTMLEIEKNVQFFVCSEEVQRTKPHPDSYIRALNRLGLPPQDCLAVEDSAAGVKAATAAGIPTVAWPLPGEDPAGFQHADVVIAFLADFPWGLLRRQTRRAFTWY